MALLNRKDFTSTTACFGILMALAHPSAAQDLPGWNDFIFGFSPDDVVKAAHGTAQPMSNDTIEISQVDFANMTVLATFVFDFGRSQDLIHSKLTTVILTGDANKPCGVFEPIIKSGLTDRYGAFTERSSPFYAVKTDPYGGYQGMQTVSSGTTFGLYRPFDNNTFIFAKFNPLDSAQNSTATPPSCGLTLTYGVKDPEVLHPPKPPTLGRQGF